MTNNELTMKSQGFMGLADFNISEGFSEELAGLDSGFDRIKIPAGGGTMFELPSENGSKACKNKHQIYLLRENEIFPMILSLPTSSNKEFSKYVKRLLSRGKKSGSVVTKFSLKKAVNKTGISYSQVQFAMDRVLTPDENKLVGKMAEQVKLYAKGKETDPTQPNIDKNTGEVIDIFE